jgi:MFS family permease
MTSIEKKKYNIRLYPMYKAFSWDLLFYYAIIFIFLVKQKNFSPTQIMLADSVYPIFKLLFNLPIAKAVHKTGKKKMLVIANAMLSLSILILIFASNIYIVFLSNALKAFAFCAKHFTESNILADSIASTKNHGKKLFSKLEGIGTRNYYFLDGISSLFTGFCFKINGYLPMIICLAFSIISTAISTCFKVEEKNNSKKVSDKNVDENSNIKDLFNSLINSFKLIFASKRLRALLLFILFFNGIIYASYTLRETLICEMGVSDEAFAVILSILTIISAIASDLQGWIQKRFRNKALTFITFVFIPTFFIVGIVTQFNINWWIQISIVLIMFAIQYAIQSPYDTLISTYSKSFTNSKVRVKVSAAVEFAICFSQFLISLVASILLDNFPIQEIYIYMGIASTIIAIITLKFMSTRIGLKPEQYSKADILKK